ncbi:MAG: hypothetical protein ACYCQJ_12815 [Nitrososphaerales archaeon]
MVTLRTGGQVHELGVCVRDGISSGFCMRCSEQIRDLLSQAKTSPIRRGVDEGEREEPMFWS